MQPPRRRSLFCAVLLVRDLFEPLDSLAIERFLNRDVRHGNRWARAVPMLLAGLEPHHIARPDFFAGAAPFLGPAESGQDNERLAKRVCMPCGSRAWFERYTHASRTCEVRRL